MVLVSAPAKVHIIGEHAVVYGHPAIIAAVGKRIYIEAEESDKVILKDDRWNSKKEWPLEECSEAATKAKKLWIECKQKGDFTDLLTWAKDNGTYKTYWKALIGTTLEMTGADSGISLHITKCEIPTGSGLGSSSAAAVAVAKAVNEAYEKNLTLKKINEIAYECEKLVHGNPSGGDNSTSSFGGLVWFQKGKTTFQRDVHASSQPNNIIKSLKGEIPHKLDNFVLVHTGQPKKSTGELVQMVRSIPESERNPKMEEIGRMTYEMKEVLKERNYDRMKQIMNRTNEILTSFGLSTPQCDSITEAVNRIDGAAKMCGACGGGIMLCWHEDKEKLMNTISNLGFEPFEADLAVEGVRVER